MKRGEHRDSKRQRRLEAFYRQRTAAEPAEPPLQAWPRAAGSPQRWSVGGLGERHIVTQDARGLTCSCQKGPKHRGVECRHIRVVVACQPRGWTRWGAAS
jgi:hypothetical protein